jgi:hypothetical protein
MLEDLIGGFINKEKATKETIQNSLEDFAEELKIDYKNLFITIKPSDDSFNFVIHLYKIENGKPTCIREVPLKEITG